MGKWSKKFSKVLTAAGISAIIAVSSLAMPISAFAARTVTDNVMIRNDASTDAGIIGSLNEGDEVVILDVLQSGDGYAWYYIQLENGATGYVRSDLIEADDSELAAFRDEAQEEEQTEEAPEETAEETSEEEEESAPETEAASTQEAAVTTDNTAEGYDATKDPNASFRTGYEEEADGSVTWYVYNDDNGSKVKISDLQAQGNADTAKSGGSGIWKTLAIIFGILTLALAAFVLFLLKSIRDGRSKTTRGRALEAAAAAGEDEDEEDEFYFEDDEIEEIDEEADEEDADPELSGEAGEEVTGDPAETGSEENTDEKRVTPDSTITMDVPDEVEPTEIPAAEIEAAIAAETAQIEKNISEADAADESSAGKVPETEEVVAEVTVKEEVRELPEQDEADDNDDDDDYEDESIDDSEDEESESEEDEDYDEDYDDEDYEDEEEEEDYEDDDYEDEEDEDEESESRAAKRSSSKGGFFGFLKKMFGSESEEDAEEGEDFDDYDDEPEEHEFDEFKEYPEDVDLLPREDSDDSDYLEDDDDYSDEETETGDSERGRLSMQRVMKNVSYKEEEADFSQDSDPDDYDDTLFEDDDMEYSFISSTRKK